MAIIQGTPGNDTLVGTRFADTIYGLAGNDFLLGLADNDTLYGGSSNDTLDGGVGIDSLIGGRGNDVYVVNNLNDKVIETANAEIDTVRSSVNYTLPNHVENLTLTGNRNINGAGNVLANQIIGNSGNNFLYGGTGIDTLYGGAGNDTLDGGSDNDILYGGDGNDALNGDNYSYGYTGNDTLCGGTGNDTLDGNAGNDILYGGTGNDSLLGSAGSDLVYGGDGDDTLSASSIFVRYSSIFYNFLFFEGDGDPDILLGGDGNDTYIVVESGDRIIETANAGIDTVIAYNSYTLGNNIENLTLGEQPYSSSSISGTGNRLNNVIVGNSTNNTLEGKTGNDSLNGGSGEDILVGTDRGIAERDTLTGGTGRDIFVLGNATTVFYDDGNSTTSGFGNYALITDFNPEEDVIRLNGRRTNYYLTTSPTGLPTGTALFRKQQGTTDELIAIIQSATALDLNDAYFSLTEGGNNLFLLELDGNNGFTLQGDYRFPSGDSVSTADINGDGFDDIIIGGTSGVGGSGRSLSYVVFGKASGIDARVDLTTLDGRNGFILQGLNYYDFPRISVNSSGDINGDGFADIAINFSGSSRRVDEYGDRYYESGTQSYVVFGKPSGFSASVDLSNLDGRNGFISSFPIDAAGDVNGDGFDDIIIGAPNMRENYVVFGKASGFDARFDTTTLDGTNGFVVEGIPSDTYYEFDFLVSRAGDINGDGFDDIIIGAPFNDPNGRSNAGESYIIYGKATGFNARIDVTTLDGSNGFILQGINTNNRFGDLLSSAGDLNADGFNDIIIGAPGAGESYIVFGKASGFDARFDLATLNGTNGFVLEGLNAYDDVSSRFSLTRAGDINGDGFDDIIIETLRSAESYVVFGKASGFDARIDLTTLDGSNGFVISDTNNRFFGRSLNSAGDINSDGFDDIIINIPGANPNGRANTGESYVLFGKPSGFDARVDLATFDGSDGLVLQGINTNDRSGYSVSRGDVNGDGYDDIILGAPSASPNGRVSAGESYVIYGQDFTGSVTRQGTAGNDLLLGTNIDDIIIGGLGNDTLRGGGGSNVLYGGAAGDDVLIFSPQNRRMDGGSGTDTLAVDGNGVTLDLTAIPNNRIRSIEIIDLTGTGNNTLQMTRLDLLNLSDSTNQLIVNGNSGDSIISTGQGWLFEATTTLDGNQYNRYTSGVATLLVDTDITRTLS
ncbi:Hemolysin-type calcium-binding region [Gloeocapsa sp. PCC 7428]|uniref:FG-GAP repeat protein n=1 Tax=Gloeocapsa sp. PCC 7428 TaxID=1173026 RepID=UPI0002A5FD77|nr:FG-GAP repeat protein [Gloeocapsa sp. PCC 7428]AFZ28724.1 Hemolysin-type calcium-binding region [Gloeocapsa sp. PCC 7428]